MTKTKKLDMELPKEGRFISSEFPILRENLNKIDQEIADIDEKLENKAPLQHAHTISDVTGLESALNNKMAANKTFTFADLSDIEGAQDAANNYVLYKSSNNNFTFGSAISLLGAHQHKTEDIVGLDDFRAKINEDLTAYYTKSEIDKLVALLTKKPVEILMTESGIIPLPDGVTDDTAIEIWAWGGGGGGGCDGEDDKAGGGGDGGQYAHVRIRGLDLKKSVIAQVGRGGRGGGGGNKNGGDKGKATFIKGIIHARGGDGGERGNGSSTTIGRPPYSTKFFAGGRGGCGGGHLNSDDGQNGELSIYGGGGGGGGGRKDSISGKGAHNGGNGGNYGANGGGGGGGYFRGKDGGKIGGDGGDGAILLKFFI
ncbi:Bgr_08870 family protein [Bartonella sp. 1-1C]|uniref:Bgr_08870 family protein n=1 Tax=Bartonella sp. 1-1C TaxID=515256 RepID=UPI0001F4CAE3|nr:Bgr_08870 family protein [Bartonella sp. 1-1C]ATO57127.1 Phage tail repeat like [Bartonella sp. 1-1C]CBI80305.1 conserved hypothetical protein [Bartonella sp. 1-1C]